VITILVDHDIEGQALTLWGTLAAAGWLTLLPMQLATFAQVGLPADSNDRTVWRTAQARGMVLLTQNRNMKGEDSLEQTIREDNTSSSLPVVTIGRIDRIRERSYRERCAIRLVELGLDIENF
jgi:hypothetical protein